MVKGKIRASFLSLLVFAFFNACSSSGDSSPSSVPISDKTVPYAYGSLEKNVLTVLKIERVD